MPIQVLDTTTISDLVAARHRRHPMVSRRAAEYLSKGEPFVFSEISIYEVRRGLYKIDSQRQLHALAEFISHSHPIPVSTDVLRIAAKLWATGVRAGRSVDDCDLIIAATASTLGATLVTSNLKHFDWIAGLPLVDWRA